MIARPNAARALSVCCMTRGPTLRVARSLALFRDVADEIVVAVDDRVDDALLRPLEAVADVLIRYPYLDPVDRPVGWLHRLCSGRWILNVDDDEIPSAALVRALPRLVEDDTVTHCFVPRRWPFPGSVDCLDQPPWHPDWQLRLVRNDMRLLWFPGVTHWPIQAVGPHRFIDAPLYHLDLLLNSRERREHKAHVYENALPGRRLAGLPMNLAVHVPEVQTPLSATPTPAEDAETIETILAMTEWPEPEPPERQPRLASRAEIDEWYHGQPFVDTDYHAMISLADEVAPFRVGETRQIAVRVENRGGHVWPWGGLGYPDVRATYRWHDTSGKALVRDGLRTPLPESLSPGGSTVVPLSVSAPGTPGRHTLAIDLVHEHVRWFACELRSPVDVLPTTRIAIVADDDDGLAPAAAAVTSALPAVEPVIFAQDPVSVSAILGYAAAPTARSVAGGRVGALMRGGAIVVRARLRPARASVDRLSGDPFLGSLARCSGLLLAGDRVLRGSDGARSAWYQALTVLSASSLGMPVTVVASADDGDGRRRAPLAGLALRHATVVRPGQGESIDDALVPAVRELGRRLDA